MQQGDRCTQKHTLVKDGDTDDLVCKEWEGLPPNFAQLMFDQAMDAINEFLAESNAASSLRICGSLPSLILTALMDLRVTHKQLNLKLQLANPLNLTDRETKVDILMQRLVRGATSDVATDAVLDPSARAPFSSASLLEILHGAENAKQWQGADSAKVKEDYQDAVLDTAYGRCGMVTDSVHGSDMTASMKSMNHTRLATRWRTAVDKALEHDRRSGDVPLHDGYQVTQQRHADGHSVHTWLPVTE